MDDSLAPRPTSPPPPGTSSPGGPKALTSQMTATWEKSDFRRLRSPYFVPRLCQVNITRLEFLRAIPQPIDFVFIVVRLRGGLTYQRTLKSDKIMKPAEPALLDAALDLSFSIQYSHNVQTENNILQLLVIRRRKRTRKLQTICASVIRMEEVVQNIIHKKLTMFGSQKGKLTPVCKIEATVSSISIADEFERQLQDDNMDYRDDLNFLSDELEEEDDLFGEDGVGPKAKKPLSKPPGRITSRVKSLLRLRKPKADGTKNSPPINENPRMNSSPMHENSHPSSRTSSSQGLHKTEELDEEGYEEDTETPSQESDFDLGSSTDDSGSDDLDIDNPLTLNNLMIRDQFMRLSDE